MTRRVPVSGARPGRPPAAGVSCALGPLERVLGDVVYPACRWQIVATAELAGADTVTLVQLAALPDGFYLSLDHLRRALAATG